MKTKITMRRTYYLNNLLSKRHFLLAIALFATLTLTAQESCYEQYLCEHNKTILTAEDADDSYEDLKKAVLAKQIYGDSYLLMVDTIAQRAVITKVDGTYIADVHVALVDSTWYMWLSVDPLADKNPGSSPYMYCYGNLIMLIDPDGNLLGTDVMAVRDGTIVGCDYEGKGTYGKTITLQFETDEDKTAWAFYSHLSEINVSVNDIVNDGDIIGKTGVSGNAKGMRDEDQHLHFEYRTGDAVLGKGLSGRDDPNLMVDTKFEIDPSDKTKVKEVGGQ